MDVRQLQVTFDCADPGALAGFWAEVLGYSYDAPPPGFATWGQALEAWGVPPHLRNARSSVVDPTGAGVRLFFQQVPEGKAAKNRLHLDVRAAPGLQGEARMAALQDEADRLVALGACLVRRQEPQPPAEAGHLVMQDLEGNEFCLD
ncbi:MAG: VOC family protein [Nocardioides sp.]|nr:VOC family protein [Nocardioides sp.]